MEISDKSIIRTAPTCYINVDDVWHILHIFFKSHTLNDLIGAGSE
jgi:hypothetical protein